MYIAQMKTDYQITGLTHWALLHARATWPDLLPQTPPGWGNFDSLLHTTNLVFSEIPTFKPKVPPTDYVIRIGWINPHWKW